MLKLSFPFSKSRVQAFSALGFLVLLGLSVATNASAKDLCDGIESGEPRQADLVCLGRFIDKEQSWPKGARDEAKKRLEALKSEASGLDEVDYYLRVSAIGALADNGHTGLGRFAVYQDLGLLPIRTYWFDDGLFIIRAAPEQRQWLGGRILEIAGQTPEDLMVALDSYSGGPDQYFQAYEHMTFFLSPPLLQAAGLNPTAESIRLKVHTTSGEEQEVDMAIYGTTQRHPGGYPPRQLHPEPLPREGEGWLTWLGASAADLPWALDEVDKTFRYRFLAESKTAHIHFRANIGTEDVAIADFLKTLETRLKRDKPRFIFWDQRQNTGGDLTRTADFARRIHKWLPKDGHVYVFTSKATFSAGIYTAFFPEWADDERTTVVGGRVGDREVFWAESEGSISLPDSEWRIYYSLQKHDLATGCTDRETCHIRRKKWQIAVGSFEPEKEIPDLSTDLIAGRDAVVEWALADIGEK